MARPAKNGNGEKALQTVATLTHLLLALGAIILAAGIAFATVSQRITTLEARIPVREQDHDLLIAMSTDVANIKADVAEIKTQLIVRDKLARGE